MEFSANLLSIVAEFEGCRLNAYKCPAGVWTIGYGHTGRDVVEGMTITPAEALTLLADDLKKHAALMASELAGLNLPAQKFEALISLSYNIGSLKAKAPTLLRKVRNNPADPSIREEFMRHVNARVNGKLQPLPGLVRRRKREADLYFS